jgi:hypothetical protein
MACLKHTVWSALCSCLLCAVLCAAVQNRFVAGGGDMWVHLHDAETGAELEVNKGHHGPVHTVRCVDNDHSTLKPWKQGQVDTQGGGECRQSRQV